MHKTIQYSIIFVTLIIFSSLAMGDAFDQTVDQIKILEAEREQNQVDIDEKHALIEQELGRFRANHTLNAPKGEFESDADYAARLSRLATIVAQRRVQLEREQLSSFRVHRHKIQAEIGRLHRRVFFTNDVTATLGRYNANEEYFPITFVANNERVDKKLYISRQNKAPILKNNWDKVVKTAYILIDPGYRRGLARVKLEYSPLWKYGVTWNFDVVYDLGHNNGIAFSPDGKYLATGNNDEYGIADIWKVENGEKFRKMDHGDRVRAVAFSPDGKYFATAGGDESRDPNDGKVIIWNMHKGIKYQTIPHSGTVLSIAFSPDSKFLATTYLLYSNTGFTHLMRVGKGWVWRTRYDAEYLTIRALTFSPDGRYIAIGKVRPYFNSLNKATLHRVNNGDIARNFHHKNRVYAVDFSPNGKYLATGNYQSVTLWEISSGRSIRQIELPRTFAYAVAFSPDGEFLAIGKSNGYIDFFRVGTEKITLETDIPRVKSINTLSRPLPVLPVYRYGVFINLAWHPSGNFISDGQKVYRTFLHSEFVDLTPSILLSSSAIDPVNTGAQFTLDFTVKNVVDLAGWQLEVAFNPSVLSAVEVKEGDFLKSGSEGTFFQRGSIDNTVGKITGLNTAILGGSSISGAGTLFSITFEAKAAGEGQLALHKALLSTVSGQTIPHDLVIHPLVVESRSPTADVNQDNTVNIQDLVLVAARFGQTGPNTADVNADGAVNIQDLVLVAAAFGDVGAAPSIHSQALAMLTTTDVQQWLSQAQHLGLTDSTSQRGIRYLENLLAALTPKETALLPNYPNPFNPETWIPYQLAKPAEVSISIYATDGQLVRTLDLGHQGVGIYESRSRAAYWDGRNELGEPVASGVYFYTLTAGEFTATRKMLIRK